MRSGSEAVGSETDVGIPEIIAGEIDVLPADGREVGKQRVRDDFAAATQVVERTAEIYGVPERDGGGDEREPTCTILLRLGGTIAKPAEAMEADGAGEGVARFALVELHGRLPPESGQLEPVEDEQRALDPTDFAQGQRQAVLAGIGPEALEKERGADRPVRTDVARRKTSSQCAVISFSSMRPAMNGSSTGQAFAGPKV